MHCKVPDRASREMGIFISVNRAQVVADVIAASLKVPPRFKACGLERTNGFRCSELASNLKLQSISVLPVCSTQIEESWITVCSASPANAVLLSGGNGEAMVMRSKDSVIVVPLSKAHLELILCGPIIAVAS